MATKDSLQTILGNAGVVDDPEILASYAESHSLDKLYKPWFVAKPKSVDEVAALVKWANETRTPLAPVSSTGVKLRGDSVPSVPEAVVVDLSGMKKILNVNRQQRMAVVEPGVTYGELGAELDKQNMVIAGSLKPKAGQSVLTDVLEAVPRLNPMIQWSFFDPLRCVEVTWGDGTRMFTGEAAGGPLDLEKQWAKQQWQVQYMGPWMLDYYRLLTQAQGSMGIVTWASLKTAVKPLIHQLYLAEANDLSDLEEFVYKAMWTRFPDEIFILNKSQLASIVGKTPEEIAKFKEVLPPWVVAVGAAGRELLPETRFEARSKDLIDIAQGFGLDLKEGVSNLSGRALYQEVTSVSEGAYWKDVYAGSHQNVFFLTQLGKTGCFLKAVREIAEDHVYPTEDIGVYIQPKHLGSSYHMEFTFPYDPDSAARTARVKDLVEAVSIAVSDMGGYYSRPYGKWAGIQLNKDAQSLMALKRLQGIFDPNDIMNPGKLAISRRGGIDMATKNAKPIQGYEVTLEDFRPMQERCSNCIGCKFLPFEKIKSNRFGRNCPSAWYYNFNTYSARGRFQLGQTLEDGYVNWEGQAIEAIFDCQACGACDVGCKATRFNLEPLAHNIALKERAVEKGLAPKELAAAVGLLETQKTMLPGMKKANRAAWSEGLKLKDLSNKETAEYAFFPGCQYAYDPKLQKKAKTWVQALLKAGVDLGYLGKADMCCGGRAKQAGFREAFETEAHLNAKAWEKAGVKKIVTPCADCYHALKRQYAQLGIPVEVVHASELLAERVKAGELKLGKTVDMAVTYHDPCHLGRLGEPFEPWDGTEVKVLNQVHTWEPARPRYASTYGVYDAPREILAAIPGLRLIEMERIRENAWCCGAGGGCSVFSPEYSDAVASERVTEAQATGAEAIVTACPWCEINLSDIESDNGTTMPVVDIVDLIAKAL
jgi:Fe-S oxidoreductase/FAD/FMN-containing dehydrogenase